MCIGTSPGERRWKTDYPPWHGIFERSNISPTISSAKLPTSIQPDVEGPIEQTGKNLKSLTSIQPDAEGPMKGKRVPGQAPGGLTRECQILT